MHPMGKIALAVVTAAVLFVTLCQPADARRRFRLPFIGTGSGYSEKIEKVHDLPDRGPYFHDGKYWDLGYFFRVGSALGVTTSSTHDHGSYVLYNGDRYTILDAEQIAAIAADIGSDPVAEHRAKIAAGAGVKLSPNTIERRDGESREAFLARVRGMQAKGAADKGTQSSQPAAMGGAGSVVVGLFLIVLVVFGMRHLLRRLPASSASGGDAPAASGQSFEQRVAERLRELNAGPAEPMPAASPMVLASVAAAPAARTFGRKLA
ncbi:MAG: hypothetical protein WDN24_11260 [Sphingomonas sp.]